MLLAADGSEILPTTSRAELVRIDTRGPERDPEWDRELERIAPVSDTLTHLRLVWLPGDPWCPCERWVVYQCWPAGTAPFGISMEELQGPDPRSYAGDYDAVLGRFVRRRHLSIDRRQWQLYHETGFYGHPYFVIQGTKGGHLRRYTSVQRALAKMEGAPTDPPAPGDLPFATPDNRTFAALRELDELSRYEGLLAFHLRSPAMIQGEQAEKARAMRQKLWNQMKSQQEGFWSDERAAVADLREMLPHGMGRGAVTTDYEAIERRFVEED